MVEQYGCVGGSWGHYKGKSINVQIKLISLYNILRKTCGPLQITLLFTEINVIIGGTNCFHLGKITL